MKAQIDEKKMDVLIDKFISEAEIKTGTQIKEHERVVMKVMGRILTEMVKEYESFFDISANFLGNRADAFVNKLEDVRVDLANASNPIRFENEKQAAAFNSESKKLNMKYFLLTITSMFIFGSCVFGYKMYVTSEKVKKAEQILKTYSTVP